VRRQSEKKARVKYLSRAIRAGKKSRVRGKNRHFLFLFFAFRLNPA
jgi:hypothetical protein